MRSPERPYSLSQQFRRSSGPKSLIRSLVLAAIATALGACSTDEPPAAVALDGYQYNTELDVMQIMNMVLEPASDILWKSGGWVVSDAGYEELYPTTDEGWEYVRKQAAIIVEVGNSLALPGRAEDDDAWLIYSEGLSQAGLQAMAAAQSQNKEDFFQAGADLYSVCTACHQAYNPEIASRFAPRSISD